jgi:hypothetical protein
VTRYPQGKEKTEKKVPDSRPAVQLKRWWYMRKKSEEMLQKVQAEMGTGLRKMVSERLAMLVNR